MTNAAEALPEDPYGHLTNSELAMSISAWPDDSTEQLDALRALAARAPGMGHNRPPLVEAIEAETAGLRRRAEEWVSIAADALIIDDESAKKVNDLIVKGRDIEEEAEQARLARIKPYREAVSLINATYHAISQPVLLARAGPDGKSGGLRRMVTVWDDRRRAEAEAEKRRLREEQRQREREAAEAQRRAEEAAAAGRGQVNAELQAAQAREAAARAQQRADAIRPEPIRSHLGQVSRTRRIEHEITDVGALVGWLVAQAGLRGSLERACEVIVTGYLRVLGVDTVARQDPGIPGVTVRVVVGTAGVRR